MISQPTHAVDFAERALVGALLAGHNGVIRAVDQLGDVETSDIKNLRLRPIVAAVLDIRDEGGNPNISSILDRLESSGQLIDVLGPDGPGYLESIMNATPDVWDIPTWARVILEHSSKRDAASKLALLQNALTSDPDRAVIAAEHLLATLKGNGRSKPEESLILKRMDEVEEQQITWLWQNRFARGKFNQLQGDPGLGKTMVMCDIAARVSTGCDWPDGAINSGPGSVIIVTSEDDPADTLKPRLRRAGADMSKIHVLETAMVFDPRTGKLGREPFDIGRHVPLLTRAVEQIGDVVLMIIDPISAYTGKVDSHKNAEVRGMLAEFLAMIAQQNICLIGIIHQNKQIGGKSVYRASGSLAFTAAARSVFMIARDHEDDRRRLLLPVKCNIARRLDGMAYRIESDGIDSPPFVHWEADPVPLTADGYLAQEESGSRKNDDDSALAKAEALLEEQLKNGPVLSKELEDTVKANYIAPATYKRARESLRCKASKQGKSWWTSLSGQKMPWEEEAQQSTSETLDALDTHDTHEPHKQEYQQYQEHQEG